ncbi:hypothetical protein HDE_05034 [Halotydeus destructor]|nr:hypothetical protein HDE_05034 [Halotydeus destructor]
MRLFVTFALFVAAVQAASDADYWIARGDKNANLRLDEWKAVVEGLSKGNDDGLAKLLAALPPQLKEARDNSRKLMSTIGTVISGIKKLTDGSPNLFQKLGLRGVLAVLGRQEGQQVLLPARRGPELGQFAGRRPQVLSDQGLHKTGQTADHHQGQHHRDQRRP